MFYCDPFNRLLYLVIVSVLCLSTMIVSLWEKFSQPNFRTIRAGVFIVFGCFGVIPTFHWILTAQWPVQPQLVSSFVYLVLMGSMYIIGALLYAGRIPERFFPGKCDYWFQSHQIFHILVIVAALLHHQGINEMAAYRLSYTCDNQLIQYNQTSTSYNLFF
jgi:adiponectin receptor